MYDPELEAEIQENFNKALFDIEEAYQEEMRLLLCRLQNKNATFVRVPSLVFHTSQAEELQKKRDEKIEKLESDLVKMLDKLGWL